MNYAVICAVIVIAIILLFVANHYLNAPLPKYGKYHSAKKK